MKSFLSYANYNGAGVFPSGVGSTYYSTPEGSSQNPGTGSTEITYRRIVHAGTIDMLSVVLDTAPGSGKSWTVTLQVNDVDSALSAVVSDGNTSATDSTHSVPVNDGDRLRLKWVPSGSPANPTKVDAVYRQTHSAGFTVPATAPSYSYYPATYYPPHGGYASGDADSAAWIPVPCAGSFSKMLTEWYASPPSGGCYFPVRCVLRKEGASTSLLCTLPLSGSTTITDTAHSVSVVAGDKVALLVEPAVTDQGMYDSGTTYAQGDLVMDYFDFQTYVSQVNSNTGNQPFVSPTQWQVYDPAQMENLSRMLVSMLFTPTTDGQFWRGFNPPAPSNSSTTYVFPFGWASSWGTTEAQRQARGLACTLKAMYVVAASAQGSGKSFAITARLNGADTAVTVTLSNATAGNITGQNVAIANGDLLDIKSVPSSSPTASAIGYSLLFQSAAGTILPQMMQNA